ncbi:trypco2 family protein [Virgisporangium aurantiacum]|uniref:Trypsin-co-occurring domain-containing protein n=1 Tax=Virgisporangium aurantiacum TaxID=175570 RepID=A0A8J3ZGI5_9ACTN|nr:trypco2 family protein [Virgisporangium aurantiacum]GIJ63436.1 hypothetical protein Vau01_109520 [Virgisporangium aurantiacum]
MDDAVELADLIGQLRGELSRAMWAGEHGDIRFVPGPVELELTISIEKTTGGDGRIRFWVLDGGASRSSTAMVTQRLTMTLDPRLASDPDRRPQISGRSFEGET